MTKIGVELGNDAKVISPPRSVSRGFSFMDFALRLVAIIGTMASAIAMGTTNQTLPFQTRFIRYKAQYSDLPTLTFFVIANVMVCGYLVLSLPFSILNIVRSNAQKSRIVLIIFDAVMLTLLIAGASASTSIVYLAHEGNPQTNWFPVCNQYNSFCKRISGALIASLLSTTIILVIIFLLAIAISRR